MVAEVRPSAKTCRELDRPGLLVGAAQLGKGGREPDQPGVVAGGDGGGPFDDGGGDRVVAGSVTASPRRVPRRPGWPASTAASAHSAAYHGRHSALSQDPEDGSGRRCRRRAAAWPPAGSSRCSASRPSKRWPAQQASGELLGVGAGVDRHAYPGRPAVRRRRACRAPWRRRTRRGQVRRDWSCPRVPSRRGSALRFGRRRRTGRRARRRAAACDMAR